jgi:hypothetical protein
LKMFQIFRLADGWPKHPKSALFHRPTGRCFFDNVPPCGTSFLNGAWPFVTLRSTPKWSVRDVRKSPCCRQNWTAEN